MIKNFCDLILLNLKEFIEGRVFFYYSSRELSMLFSLLTRLFELAFLKNISISSEILNYFCVFFEQAKNENKISDFFTDQTLIMITAILAGLDVKQKVIVEYLRKIVNENINLNNELRYLVIILIDNDISVNDRQNFAQLREVCLDNSISKNHFFTVQKKKDFIPKFYPIQCFNLV